MMAADGHKFETISSWHQQLTLSQSSGANPTMQHFLHYCLNVWVW